LEATREETRNFAYLRETSHVMIGAQEPPGEPKMQHQAGEATDAVRKYAVSELLQGGREAILLHDGAEYRLRITANGKLILTK
jgi:hemin uptake protein HemP